MDNSRAMDQFRLLVESTNDYAILMIDPEGRITKGNPGVRSLFGYAAADLIGEPLSHLFVPEDRAVGVPEAELNTAAREGRAADERWHLRKDGSRFWANGIVQCLRDDSGTLKGYAKILRDATDRLEIERALSLERAYMAAVLDQMPSGLSIAEAPSGRLLVHNRAAVDLIGHPLLASDDYTGYRQYGAIHEDGTPYRPEEYPIARALLTGEKVDQEEMLYRRGDGTLTYFSVNAGPVRDDTGKLIAAVSTFHDVSEQKRVERELRQALERERRIANTLQHSLLLAPSLESLKGLEVAPFYEPALDEALVGGDFYDAFPVEGGRIALVVGDASGKGLDAAVRTAEVKFAIRAFLSEHPYPARALCRVNDFLCGMQWRTDLERESFVVLSLAVVDPGNGEVTLSVAGAEPPLVVRRDGDATPADVRGLPLGVEAHTEYDLMTVRLKPRDTLVMATDGITEARRGDKMLGYDGLVRLACEYAGSADAQEMVAAIMRDVREFAGGRLQDDACLLFARLR